jgi:hypothetical protein
VHDLSDFVLDLSDFVLDLSDVTAMMEIRENRHKITQIDLLVEPGKKMSQPLHASNHCTILRETSPLLPVLAFYCLLLTFHQCPSHTHEGTCIIKVQMSK